MVQNMKSVVLITPDQTDNETATKFVDWLRHNKPSAMGDKYVPGVEETRKYLESMKSS